MSLHRARWALDEDELAELKKRAETFGLDKSDEFADFEKKYLKASEEAGETAPIPQKANGAEPSQQQGGKTTPDAKNTPSKAPETIEYSGKSGIIERGKTIHANERMREREVTDDDVRDALTNPLHTKEVVTDELGRKSQTLIGKNATVCINPDTGKVITAWKTGTKTRKKYEGGD